MIMIILMTSILQSRDNFKWHNRHFTFGQAKKQLAWNKKFFYMVTYYVPQFSKWSMNQKMIWKNVKFKREIQKIFPIMFIIDRWFAASMF